MSPLIDLRNIVKSYQTGEVTSTVLHGVSLSIRESEFVAITGASGSGKSSMMNIIGLLDKPTQGQYFLNGQDVVSIPIAKLANIRNQQIGFVFQAFFLLPRLTVLQNVGLPLSYRELNESAIEEQSRSALQRVGIEHLAARYPHELSGGQQQRVAIARALATKPSVILADEPTGALDSKIGQEIMELFIQLNKFDKNTIVIITHDLKIAAQCSRIIKVEDGRIISAEETL